MIFLIILIISFISILYVFKNDIIKLSNERKSIYKIQNITFIFIVLFLFTLSSLIYNYVGNPFINIKNYIHREINSKKLRHKKIKILIKTYKNLMN